MMREQARVIATQHSYWKRDGGNFRAKNAVPFEKWFLIGIRRQEKKALNLIFFLLDCSG